MFENAAWSKDSSKIVVVGNAPPADNRLVKSVRVYPRAAFVEGAHVFPPPIESLRIGRGPAFSSSTLAPDSGVLFLEREKQVRAWRIPSLTPAASMPATSGTSP